MARSQFAVGYQEALADILEVARNEGPEAAIRYVEENSELTTTPMQEES